MVSGVFACLTSDLGPWATMERYLGQIWDKGVDQTDRLFSMGYEGLGTVRWIVVLGPWSFVFKGLGTVLVSFPIENFWDAGPLGVARR